MVQRVLALIVLGLALPDAAHAWRYAVNGSARGGGDEALDVAVDTEGNVIAGGGISTGRAVTGVVRQKLLVTKLQGRTGKTLWTFVSEAGSSAFDLTLDPGGDVFVCGYQEDDQGIVLRLSGVDGRVLWRVSEPLGGFSAFRAIARMPDGSVVVGGRGLGDTLIVRLAGDTGAELWRFTGVNAASLAVDPAGDVLVGGFLGYSVLDSDGIVLKLAGSDGSEVWRRVFETPANDFAADIATTSTGDAVAAGLLGETTAWIERLDGATGATEWSIAAPADPIDAKTPRVIMDAADDVVATGWGPGIVKLDGATGGLVWSHASPTGSGRVTTFAGGDLVSTGEEDALVRLDPATGVTRARIRLGGGVLTRLAAGPDDLLVGAGKAASGDYEEFYYGKFYVVGIGDRLSGTMLSIRDDPANPLRRRLKLKSRDPLMEVGLWSGFDTAPSPEGVRLQIENPTTAEAAALVFPSAGWTRPTASWLVRFKYRDTAQLLGPCRSAKLDTGTGLQVTCTGPDIDFSLDEPLQGPLRVRLQVGDPATSETHFYAYCLEFTPVVDEPGRFLARASGPPAACP